MDKIIKVGVGVMILKDNKILLVIPLIAILILMLGIMCYDNYNARQINEKLKKEKFELKEKIKKLEEEKLKAIVKGE